MTRPRGLWFWLAVILLGAAALSVLSAPPLPAWGERHTPHRTRPPLELTSGSTVTQTFIFEYRSLDRVVLWLDRHTTLPSSGGIRLRVASPAENREQVIPFSDISPSGVGIMRLQRPLAGLTGARGELRIELTEPNQTVYLRYQPDPSKYPEGNMTKTGSRLKGDLAFQLRYQRPALSSGAVHGGMALLILLAGALTLRLLTMPNGQNGVAPRWRNILIPLATTGFVTGLFAIFLLRPGYWVGPSDFSKDAAYLSSAAEALRTLRWPLWSHRTCGGMALLGNPEGNTFSLGTLLAAFLPSDRALLLLLCLEAGLGTAGAWLLARKFGFSTPASTLASLIYGLAGSYPYRVVEGLTPVGGAVAFLPWALLFFFNALQWFQDETRGESETPPGGKSPFLMKLPTAGGPWTLLTGSTLALIFFRGDVHVVAGIVTAMAAWAVVVSLQRRRLFPLGILAGVLVTTLLWSLIKVLPYLEQPSLIETELRPYSTPLIRGGVLDDVFLALHDRAAKQPVLHGQYPEAWGNFGAYLGAIPLLLAGVGALTAKRWRAVLVAGALSTFLIAEGTLFEYVLRHLPLAGSLLRVPTRLLAVTTLFIALLAATGFERLREYRSARAPRIAAWLLALASIALLARGTSVILSRNTVWDTHSPSLFPYGPTQMPHLNNSLNQEKHATKLLLTGFLLPHICGDQNNPPLFIQKMRQPLSLASVPTITEPNHILVQAPPGANDIPLRTRFVSSWTSRDAEIIPEENGAALVVTPPSHPSPVILNYQGSTKRAQQSIAVLFLLVTSVGGYRCLRRSR